MGCIARLGCLVILLIGGIVGYLTRGMWLHRVIDRPAGAVETAATRPPVWEPLTDASGERGRAGVQGLAQPGGPAFVNLTGAELASFVWRSIAGRAPEPTDSVEAMVQDDRVLVRASIRLGELGIAQHLGPLASMLGDRERMQIAGTLRVVQPGLAEYDVKELQLARLKVPAAALPRLVPRLSSIPRPEGMSPTGVPVRTPAGVGDVRVARGYVTLYRSTAAAPTP